MNSKRLLLCTDMDRTVIPNGSQPEHPAARELFRRFCEQSGIRLAYVTGRHLQLVKEAIADFGLPEPDFAITDVGSKIYRISGGDWHEMSLWEEQIAADWRGQTHAQLRQALLPIRELILQEAEKQNRFKLSYYLALDADKERVMERMRELLAELDVDASLIWSIDDVKLIGLLDVLPQNATKLHGLLFLQQQLGYTQAETLFAGDSGNDLPVLGSFVRSVLVANASGEVRALACQLVRSSGHPDTLYLAQQDGFDLGGNYAAGVLQGICHFYPEFRRQFEGGNP